MIDRLCLIKMYEKNNSKFEDKRLEGNIFIILKTQGWISRIHNTYKLNGKAKQSNRKITKNINMKFKKIKYTC